MNLRIRILMRLHVFFYRLTGGWIGGRMAGQTVLLLQTMGRTSGRLRTTPINFFKDGNRFIVVASNWGRDGNPDWYLNLRKKPQAVLQVGRAAVPVSAREADAGEYRRLWKLVTAGNPYYERYQAQTRRKIPLIILDPKG